MRNRSKADSLLISSIDQGYSILLTPYNQNHRRRGKAFSRQALSPPIFHKFSWHFITSVYPYLRDLPITKHDDIDQGFSADLLPLGTLLPWRLTWHATTLWWKPSDVRRKDFFMAGWISGSPNGSIGAGNILLNSIWSMKTLAFSILVYWNPLFKRYLAISLYHPRYSNIFILIQQFHFRSGAACTY